MVLVGPAGGQRRCPKVSLNRGEQAAWVYRSTGSHVPLRGPGTQQVLNKYLMNESINVIVREGDAVPPFGDRRGVTSALSKNFVGHGLRLPYRHLHTKDSIEDSSHRVIKLSI